MDDWFVVIALSTAMLVGCYLAGCIPLAFSLSEEKLKLVTILGAGLLVGTALAVIIPEGVSAIYEAGHDHHHDQSDSIHASNHQVAEEIVDSDPKLIGPQRHLNSEAHEGETHKPNAHQLIGMSLVAGFVFMLLVDQLGGSHSHGGTVSDPEIPTVAHTRSKYTATLGLCVHAAADGVALGAATSVAQTTLTIIVFCAIMLHKAPAAFGLVSFLLHDGLDRGRIRKHLLAFSAAAPIGAIVTFLILTNQNKEALQEANATGIAMLFSAGTFLYVATVHILPEVSSTSIRTTATDGTVIVRDHKGFTKLELICIVFGSLIPVGLSLGHSH